MKEELITFETAKLAKEKKYDIPHSMVYYKSGTPQVAFSSKTNEAFGEEYIAAPTQSLLQKWLREKHQIFIEIGVDCTCEPKFCFYIHKFIGNPNDLAEREWNWERIQSTEWYLYRTYEKALEEGLKVALKEGI